MKLNPELFNKVGETPYEVQDLENGKKCEVYIINEAPCFQTCVNQGKLVTWSTIDGVNYRLLAEKGYYELVGDLYTPKVNSEWMKFWDEAEGLKKKFTFRFMAPLALVYFALLLGLSILIDKMYPGNGTTFVLIGGLIGMFAFYLLSAKLLTKKMKTLNYEAVQRIKKIVGAKNFDKLLKAQEKYVKKFYNDLKANQEDTNEEKAEEITDNSLDTQEKATDVEALEEVEVVEENAEKEEESDK